MSLSAAITTYQSLGDLFSNCINLFLIYFTHIKREREIEREAREETHSQIHLPNDSARGKSVVQKHGTDICSVCDEGLAARSWCGGGLHLVRGSANVLERVPFVLRTPPQ